MKINYTFGITVLLFSILCIAIAGGQPSAYGKLRLNTSKGKVNLRDAVVELKVDSSKGVNFKTYADTKGNFAFYNVPPGKYELTVYINGRLALQKIDTAVAEKRIILLDPQNPRIGEINIVK